jgi:hypothetical protein
MEDDVVELLFQNSFNDAGTVHITGFLLENRSDRM